MDESLILELVKAGLGISSTVRDAYIQHVIKGVISELEDEKGLLLLGSNPNHLMFVVDMSQWRYRNRDSEKGLPRHLQYRLHNLIISAGGKVL